MEERILQLEATVEDLKAQIEAMKSVSTLPFEVEKTFDAKGFLNGTILETPLSFAIAGMGMNREIGLNLSGEAETVTITVLDYPHTFLELNNRSFNNKSDSPLNNAKILIPIYVT